MLIYCQKHFIESLLKLKNHSALVKQRLDPSTHLRLGGPISPEFYEKALKKYSEHGQALLAAIVRSLVLS
jgi:hypothetical protein